VSTLINVPIGRVKHSPFRLLKDYPWKESKIKALQKSIEDVGLWEGIIARGDSMSGYQIAFGHHRLEAATRAGLATIPLIVRGLSDEQMIQFMGRENMEDYNADFLTMLNSWEAAVKFSDHGQKNLQSIEVARVLGWTSKNAGSETDEMRATAIACSNAHKLILGGYNNRKDFDGCTVRAARQICTRAVSTMDRLDKAAQSGSVSHADKEMAKDHIAKGAKAVAKEVSKGQGTQNLAGRVEAAAFESAAETKTRETPLFAIIAKGVADNIRKTLSDDADSRKVKEIVKALELITMAEDWQAIRSIKYELCELADRAMSWDSKLPESADKVKRTKTRGKLQVVQGGAA